MENNIQSLKAMAVQKGGLAGNSFIAEVTFTDGVREMAAFLAPRYDLNEMVVMEAHIVEAAIAKQGYEMLDERVINDEKGLKTFIEEINEK